MRPPPRAGKHTDNEMSGQFRKLFVVDVRPPEPGADDWHAVCLMTLMPRGTDRPKILVADDDPGIRSIVGEVLEAEGYAVVLASNGVQALEHVRSAPPDCIVLDLHMPVMDGTSFLAAWRADPAYTKVPTVLFTSEDDAVTLAAALETQACISKPFELDALTDTIARLLAASAAAAVEPEPVIDRDNSVENSRPGLGQEFAPVARQTRVLLERAQLTRLAIARSQRTIRFAEDYLDRVGQTIWVFDENARRDGHAAAS